MDPQSPYSTQKQQFQISDLVWSKITGYPWWPATIIQLLPPPSLQYKVQFLADNTYSYLPSNKLIHYDEGKAKYQDQSRSYKGLEKAIGCAERIRGRSLRNLGGSGCYKNAKVMSYKRVQIVNEEMINIKEAGQQIKSCLDKKQEEFRTWSSKPNRELVRVNQAITKPKKEKKLNLANSLLARYKLIHIPPIQEYSSSHQLSRNHKFDQKHQQVTSISQDVIRIKFIRKINEILRKKELSSSSVCQKISVYLADSIINKRKQGVKGVHSGLFQWINCSDGRFIEDSYMNWEESQEKQNTGLTQNPQITFKKSLEEIK